MFFISNIASILCVIIAGLLAFNGNKDWGWFLLSGLLLAEGTSSYYKNKRNG